MNAWDIRSDDERPADSLPTFIIFCEDMVSEPVYLKYFETPAIKVNPVKCQKSKMDNVLHAIMHCVSHELMEEREGEQVLTEGNTHVWCVFDRDMEEDADKQAFGNTEFNESIATARRRGIKVAWSNDAFELWVLLHFEEVDPGAEINRYRATYYSRLTALFKDMPHPNEDLKKCIAYQDFDYKTSLKRENNFRSIVRPEILPNTAIAIVRAKNLEDYHLKSGVSTHRQAPCTLMYQLVEELIRVGGKEI
jgi:RloB-like protein